MATNNLMQRIDALTQRVTALECKDTATKEWTLALANHELGHTNHRFKTVEERIEKLKQEREERERRNVLTSIMMDANNDPRGIPYYDAEGKLQWASAKDPKDGIIAELENKVLELKKKVEQHMHTITNLAKAAPIEVLYAALKGD